ncbi:MAG: hypothetical protein A2511_12030 [Deltaproteobacteria bacterium RIFOXYD12_FULL_50_9]|nr:MAG: hypothetical protein A2511_12030 [Deltaproteobacteria bacterium RIFOXYD12_FULL_50_9]
MGISSSLYSSISGLNTMGNAMSVLGDNVANVNTISFKSSRATFQDVLSQSVSTAAGAAQVGRGVTLSTIDGLFAQGSFESSSTPTDMAIGGQGFFMLRQPDSTEAGKYSRAGEFRFDQEGFLVNPVGYYAQGWTLDSTTGERQGTIGDIRIGKNTPPVQTEQVDLIVNVDQREVNEETEIRLFNAWDARNTAAANPTAPIDPKNYEYTSAIKVYDSVGASHDLTIYFDRTTNSNEWEFLVTCVPSEDQRLLDTKEQIIYAPNSRYNYTEHKGAGALMYGVINFSTSGEISTIDAWDVPPDSEVNPALDDNRLVIAATDSYYKFAANFTGGPEDASLDLNLGARFSGISTDMKQVLVSSGVGAFSDSSAQNRINSETYWADVYDANSNGMTVDANPLTNDIFDFTGFSNDGTEVSLNYIVDETKKVQDLLERLGQTFGCTATIDGDGRLVMTDNQGGESAMYITDFTTTWLSGADPFGTNIDINTSKQKVISTERAMTTSTGDIPTISASTDWSSVYLDAAPGPNAPVPDGATFCFAGTKPDGTSVVDLLDPLDVLAHTFTVNAADPDQTNTVQDLLDFLEGQFDCDASIDNAGRLLLTDWAADTSDRTSLLSVTSVVYGGGAPAIFGAAAFDTQTADVAFEDGSRMGDSVSNAFTIEPLSSTQYASSSTTIFQDQDGFSSGFLQSVSVNTAGIITGHYSNGQVLQKAQVGLATFNNVAGLFKDGGNVFSETTDSGAPVTGAPGTNGLGSIAPNSLEQSNVDIGTEFVKLITTQRGFQANSKIISITDEMLADLINIKR